MKDRITELMNTEQVSIGRLAEILGVQRSGISHILSGRNNPGYDFITRLMRSFPTIDPEWLLLGTGNMYKTTSNSEGGKNEQKKRSIDSLNLFNGIDKEKTQNVVKVDSTKESKNDDHHSNSPKNDIEKIVIFMTDGTFISYSPK